LIDITASQLPPGPSLPSLGQTFRWILRPDVFMERTRASYGDVFTVRLAGVGNYVFVSDPELIKQVFTADTDQLRAGEANWPLMPVLGTNSVLLLDGKAHLSRRRVLLPPFHGERLERYRTLFAEIAARHIERWPRGEPFELLPRLQGLTLEAIMRVVFGEDEDPQHLERLGLLMTGLAVTATRPVGMIPWLRHDFGRFSPMRRFMEVRRGVDDALLAEIARRRERGALDERHDVLSMMLQSGLSDDELRDELMTLLVAGHETTTVALSWAFERLLRHPGMYQRLATDERWPEAVVHETLRLRPPLPVVARRVKQPYRLDGHTIPAGDNIAPCIWLTHRRSDIYPDPHAFRPERFLEAGPETYSWLPFGGGTRRCIGAPFAQMEMAVVLRTVAERVELRPAEAAPEPVGRRAIVLSPKRGTRVIALGAAG
jgi:cytochrome P450